jgi:2-polyprenyl-6-hydroxyphenyl methylase/3-demethylubiquinone-9 3-methyltransferase
LSAQEDPERFDFGANWRSFLERVDEARVGRAVESLRATLGTSDLAGARFLDVGSGSGLFSLAARRLDARVVSFDADAGSVACTEELRRRFRPGDDAWEIAHGSVLDETFLRSLGVFEVVYAWGVLHHTGALWRALELTIERVAADGRLLVALYNDQGWRSRFWRRVKRTYARGPAERFAVAGVFVPAMAAAGALHDLARARSPLARFSTPGERGMSVVHDWRDWLGGLPYEVASPDAVITFCAARGLSIETVRTVRGLGCNQYVCRKR